MATYASRPAWAVRSRAISAPRVLVPAGIGLLVAASLILRTREFGVGFWIDEGLSVGIADRPLGAIPAALKMDGSPPLYYGILHVWIAVLGSSETATHALSLLFALLAVPIAWWAGRAAFGERAGWMAAGLAAFNPFLTWYGQETRMYALVAVLGIPATVCFLRAYALTDAPEPARRPWALGFAVALAAMLYTHNWTLFFAAGCGATWLGLLIAAPAAERRELLRDGLIGFGGALLLYAPWLPTVIYQSGHTGAPWSDVPTLGRLIAVPGKLLGGVPIAVLALGGCMGLAALVRRSHGRVEAAGRAVLALAGVATVTVLLAWLSSQVSPAWANRYLAVALAPFLLLAAAGLANAGRVGLVALAIAAVMYLGMNGPGLKSNVRDLTETIGPSLRPGDLVVTTQPEQVPVLSYYLPPGLRYATLTGPVRDLGVTDWRDGVRRLQATSAERDLQPLMDALPVGHRLVLIEPVFFDLSRWRAPWTELVRLRSQEWEQYLSNDEHFHVTAVQPPAFMSPQPNPVRATVLVKTA